MKAEFELSHIRGSAVLVILIQENETEFGDGVNVLPQGRRSHQLEELNASEEREVIPLVERELA